MNFPHKKKEKSAEELRRERLRQVEAQTVGPLDLDSLGFLAFVFPFFVDRCIGGVHSGLFGIHHRY